MKTRIGMDWTILLNYVRQGEKSDVKFFAQIENVSELGPTVSGMLNHRGGYIFLGFDNRNFHLIGTEISKEDINNFCLNTIQPNCNLDIVFIQRLDKSIMVIQVPEGQEKPYYFENTCYVMEGAYPKSALLEKRILAYNEESLYKVSEDIDLNKEDLNLLTSEIAHLEVTLVDKNIMSTEIKMGSFQRENLNHRQSQVLNFIEEQGSVSNKQYRSLFSVSHKTAHLELVDLVSKNYLISNGQGRSTCYVKNQSVTLPVYTVMDANDPIKEEDCRLNNVGVTTI